MNEQLSSLVTKYITGDANERETLLVQQWIAESPKNMDYFISMKEAWHDALEHHRHPVINTDAAFNRLRGKLQAEETIIPTMPVTNAQVASPKKIITLFRTVAAAVIVVLITCGLWLYKSSSKTIPAMVQVNVPNGHMKQLLLPDGTEVLLNAGSHFRYAADFGQSAREVSLEGEAYFKVQHQENMPFVVKAGGYTVTDIGTVFTISAYPGNANFETAVMEGKVEVSGDGTKPGKLTSVLLNHNEVLKIKTHPVVSITDSSSRSNRQPGLPAGGSTAVNDATLLQVIQTPQMDKYEGWKDNILVFEDESFENVARRLERTFAVKISISTRRLADLHYTGKFTRVQTIDDALKIIRLTTPILYRVEKDSIIITPGR